MGRPQRIKQRLLGNSRRDFFRRTGSAVAVLAASPSLSLSGTSTSSPKAVFRHGVASGDPLHDRVVLWTRVSGQRAATTVVHYEVATDPALRHVVLRGRVRTGADQDHTVKVDVWPLRPGTTYYYRFKAQGEMSPTGRTRTLPLGHARHLRMAVASCSNHAYGYFNAYRHIAERADLDLVMHLGDYLYEYGDGEYGDVRPTEPPTEILTLADYRLRHAQYKSDKDLQEAHRQHPWIIIWDDHETANDAWKGGAENHTEGAEGRWRARRAAALQAYFEWMPVRPASRFDPARNWRSFRYGDLADLLMLEQRLTGRSQQLQAAVPVPGLPNMFSQTGAFADEQRSLLGNEQERWLADRLRGSTTRWRFLGQGVMFAQLKGVAAANAAGGGLFLNPDQWDGYQPARNRLYQVLEGSAGQPPVNNVVVLTGDIHSSWAADLTRDPNNPLVATGGYDPVSGDGSRAVEFVGTSITSPGLSDPNGSTTAYLRSVNPHFKYIDLNRRGYMLLDVTHERAVAEWWYVDTVASPSRVQAFGMAFEVREGRNRLSPSAQTPPKTQAPMLAP